MRDLAIAGVLILWLVYTRIFWALQAAHLSAPPCPFYYLTGHPCPFCGGTRSFAYTWSGDIADAVRLYPLGPVLFAGAFVGIGGLRGGDDRDVGRPAISASRRRGGARQESPGLGEVRRLCRDVPLGHRRQRCRGAPVRPEWVQAHRSRAGRAPRPPRVRDGAPALRTLDQARQYRIDERCALRCVARIDQVVGQALGERKFVGLDGRAMGPP